MKCSLCGHSFTPDEAHRACQSCWLAKFCSLVRCPNCGFEMPSEGTAAAERRTVAQPQAIFGKAGGTRFGETAPAPAAFTLIKDEMIVTADNNSSNGGIKKMFGWLAGAMGGKSSGGFCAAESTSCPHAVGRNGASCHARSESVGGGMALLALEPGRTTRIQRLDTSRRDGLRQLLALGLLPDTEITLLRRFPTLVVQLGHSQFAIDRELAALVFVSG